jgi:hypothetical protein
MLVGSDAACAALTSAGSVLTFGSGGEDVSGGGVSTAPLSALQYVKDVAANNKSKATRSMMNFSNIFLFVVVMATILLTYK